jgi:hypothetical protein
MTSLTGASRTKAAVLLRNLHHVISPDRFYIAPRSPSTFRASAATAGFLALSAEA